MIRRAVPEDGEAIARLVEQLGGPSIPGIGFGMGVERLLMIQDRQCAQSAPEQVLVYLSLMASSKNTMGT